MPAFTAAIVSLRPLITAAQGLGGACCRASRVAGRAVGPRLAGDQGGVGFAMEQQGCRQHAQGWAGSRVPAHGSPVPGHTPCPARLCLPHRQSPLRHVRGPLEKHLVHMHLLSKVFLKPLYLRPSPHAPAELPSTP